MNGSTALGLYEPAPPIPADASVGLRGAGDPRARVAEEPLGEDLPSTGAAALAPNPPCSTVTTTTIGFDVAVAGTNPAYQASSCWPLIWALPVAP